MIIIIVVAILGCGEPVCPYVDCSKCSDTELEDLEDTDTELEDLEDTDTELEDLEDTDTELEDLEGTDTELPELPELEDLDTEILFVCALGSCPDDEICILEKLWICAANTTVIRFSDYGSQWVLCEDNRQCPAGRVGSCWEIDDQLGLKCQKIK